MPGILESTRNLLVFTEFWSIVLSLEMLDVKLTRMIKLTRNINILKRWTVCCFLHFRANREWPKRKRDITLEENFANYGMIDSVTKYSAN